MPDYPIILIFVHSCHVDSLSFCLEQGDIVRSLQSESMQALNLSKSRWAVLSSELENTLYLPAVLDCQKLWFSNIFLTPNSRETHIRPSFKNLSPKGSHQSVELVLNCFKLCVCLRWDYAALLSWGICKIVGKFPK